MSSLARAHALALAVAVSGGAVEGPGTYKRVPGPRVGGFKRSFLLHVPTGYDGATPLPLVIALHGAFSDARSFARQSGLSVAADREGFLVAYPNGIGLFGLLRHWNSGHCCGKAHKDGIDDVGFVLSVVEQVARETPVDRERLFLIGYSNGGMLAHRIAAERPGLLAAVAVVAGTIGGKPTKDEPEWTIPTPPAPVPIVMVHGRDDANVPYAGGRGRGGMTTISARESAQRWVATNGCAAQPTVDRLAGDTVEREAWGDCRAGADVVLYSIDGWPHDWPGPFFTRKLPADDPRRQIDAGRLIWEFFRDRRRRSQPVDVR